MKRTNQFGQPIGPDLDGWSPPKHPEPVAMHGRYVTLEPLAPEHAAELFPVFAAASDSLWTYVSIGPFPAEADLADGISGMIDRSDRLPYAVRVDSELLGWLSYLRIDASAGTIEIGSIMFSPPLQHTRAGTESIYLLIDRAFELGYRRVEWKCDDLNQPSRRAALRYGFTYEGTFKKAIHYKGRSRDTAWYAITDEEWNRLAPGYRAWLDPSSFDASGGQFTSLSELTRLIPDR